MQINIQVVNVQVDRNVPTKSGKGVYDKATVTYKDLNRGNITAKQIFPFSLPSETFKAICNMEAGNAYSVEMEKNEKGIWEWMNVFRQDAIPEEPMKSSETRAVPVVKSTYETPEERASRQRQIGRAGAVNSAISMLTAEGKMPTLDQVLGYAEQIYSWVSGPDFKDDLPE